MYYGIGVIRQTKRPCVFMGLITKEEFSDLSIIRRIRNEFAHQYKSLSFSNNDIHNRILSLNYSKGKSIEGSGKDKFSIVALALFIVFVQVIGSFLLLPNNLSLV